MLFALWFIKSKCIVIQSAQSTVTEGFLMVSVYRSLGVNTVVKVCYECATGINYTFLEDGVF